MLALSRPAIKEKEWEQQAYSGKNGKTVVFFGQVS